MFKVLIVLLAMAIYLGAFDASHLVAGGVGYAVGRSSKSMAQASSSYVVEATMNSDSCDAVILEIPSSGNPMYDATTGLIRKAVTGGWGWSRLKEISVKFYTAKDWVKYLYPDKKIVHCEVEVQSFQNSRGYTYKTVLVISACLK
jgi:hypothetical protein